MNYNKMYYLQRFQAAEERTTNIDANIGRMIQSDYMGSTEFELGGSSQCFRWLRARRLSIFPVKKLEGNVTFYVVGTEHCLERFNQGIDRHLDGGFLGSKAKEWTGLYESFVSKHHEFNGMYRKIKVWLDITGTLNGHNNDIPLEQVPVLFTADRFLAIRMYLELSRGRYPEELFEHNLFEKVYIWKSKQVQTVAGLNEDNSITVKAFGKKQRVHRLDVWPEQHFPLETLKSFGVF